ncbi:MFS transporter [Demequina capsici]|uniref:MFS transporter n=1 Tax=Demequina capsici TaxID=3075620 RepID=A0AA96JDP4_9MICO|nr:MFS transporter [Demequina sp. PMTSA13]WNM28306.1 MFS transporter [Demequina sp. PMTSA13]
MTAPSPAPTPTRSLQRARVGVALLFLMNGVGFANLVPRLPEIRVSLGLSYTGYGVTIAMQATGALLIGLVAGHLIRRLGSALVATLSMTALGVGVALAGVAPTAVLFGAALFLTGGLDAIADVAQNAHGIRVQRAYGRSILNSFHATWSIGAVAGGLMGGAAAGLKVPLSAHLAVVALLMAVVNLAGHRLLLRGPERDTELDEAELDFAEQEAAVPHHPSTGAVTRGVWLMLLALGVIAMSGTWVEDAGATWSASYLTDRFGAGATVAALGFVALQGMQFVGRTLGDRMVDRWGQRAVARVGALIGLVGMGSALAFPTLWGTILGFGLAGFGVATLIPSAMHAADELPGFRPGSALTILGGLLRASFLLSPPVVGAIADSYGLRAGLLMMPVSAVLVLALAGVLATRHEPSAHGGPTVR